MNLTDISRVAMEALIPGLVIGTAAVIAIAAILKRIGPLNATTRFVIWMAALAVLPLIPSWHVAVVQPRLVIPVPRDMPLIVLSVYSGLVQLFLLRIFIGYIRIRRLRGRTYPAPADVEARLRHWLARCPTRRNVVLRLSDKAKSPMAIGFRRPMIVMPSALLLELTEEEFDNLGVHELAHIRRYDDWTNLLQRVIHALLFFHPAVYWIARKLNFEREVACDDWVVAANGPRSYAQCLTKVVELRRWHRGALLTSGAFFGKRQILKRVELLLDKTRNAATRVSGLVVVAMVITIVGATLQVSKLPAFVAITETDGGNRSSSRWTDDNRDLRVEMRGDILFAPAERSIASVSPFGYFEIRETKGWTRRRLEVRPSSSAAPEEKYFVNGRQTPFDATAHDWAAAIYPFLMRELGLDAERRVGRILARRGASGVIEEVNLIRNDNIKRQYLNHLMEHAELTSEDLRQVAMSARKIASDNEKAEFLLANAHRFAAEPLRGSYFHAVDSIASDNDRRRVLLGMLEADGHSPETAALVGKSAKSMSSDHEKAEVLIAMHPGSGESGCALLKAARTIQSDSDRARVLRESGYLESPQCREAYFAVVNLIASDHDRSTVLREMLDRPGHLRCRKHRAFGP